jgi:hypothetical protein
MENQTYSPALLADKFSYSKLETFDSCGFKYKLKHIDGHNY